MDDDPFDPTNDPFGPPAVPTEVGCLHCHQTYASDLIEWRIETTHDGQRHGFWCCPVPGCDGRGFGFDLLPTDPTYRDERGGWVFTDDEDEDDLDPPDELPPRSRNSGTDTTDFDDDIPF